MSPRYRSDHAAGSAPPVRKMEAEGHKWMPLGKWSFILPSGVAFTEKPSIEWQGKVYKPGELMFIDTPHETLGQVEGSPHVHIEQKGTGLSTWMTFDATQGWMSMAAEPPISAKGDETATPAPKGPTYVFLRELALQGDNPPGVTLRYIDGTITIGGRRYGPNEPIDEKSHFELYIKRKGEGYLLETNHGGESRRYLWRRLSKLRCFASAMTNGMQVNYEANPVWFEAYQYEGTSPVSKWRLWLANYRPHRIFAWLCLISVCCALFPLAIAFGIIAEILSWPVWNLVPYRREDGTKDWAYF